MYAIIKFYVKFLLWIKICRAERLKWFNRKNIFIYLHSLFLHSMINLSTLYMRENKKKYLRLQYHGIATKHIKECLYNNLFPPQRGFVVVIQMTDWYGGLDKTWGILINPAIAFFLIYANTETNIYRYIVCNATN